MDRQSQPRPEQPDRSARLFRARQRLALRGRRSLGRCARRATDRVRLAPTVAIALIALAGAAQAGGYRGFARDDGEFARAGLYLGGGLVGGFTTRLEGQLTEIPGVDNVEVDPSVGLAARAGARITPHLALEAHYEWMDDFETSIDGIEVAETRTQALTADVKGYLATGRVQPYLAAGAGFLSARSDDPVTTFQKTDTDFAARFGGGVEFYVNEHIGVSVDSSYVVPTGDVEDLDYVSVGAGVFFRF